MKQEDLFRLSGILCLALVAIFNLSFKWPFENCRVTSTFGESRYDHFHDGIDIISGNEKVYPVAEGELLFFWDRSLFPSEDYGGGGNYKILKHQGDLYSVYMHLEDSRDYKRVYAEDECIGIMGNTGRSFGKHLHFSIFKLKENLSINPLSMLPRIKDEKSPVISGICVRIDDKYYPIKDKSKIRLTRHYPLHLKISDKIRGYENLGIYRLKVALNDNILTDTEFSRILFLRNELTIGGKGYNYLYDNNGYYVARGGEYRNGVNRLEITAVDFLGNTTKKEISFDVNLDIE